jgi:hypothetical protein
MGDNQTIDFLPTRLRGTGALQKICKVLNRVCRKINNLQFVDGQGSVYIHEDAILLDGGGLSRSDFAFGAEVTAAAVVTVYRGYIITPLGANVVDDTSVSVVGAPTYAAPHYCYLSWETGGEDAATIPTPALAAMPEPSGTTYRVPLCEVYYDDAGILRIGKIHHIGNIHVTYIPTGA